MVTGAELLDSSLHIRELLALLLARQECFIDHGTWELCNAAYEISVARIQLIASTLTDSDYLEAHEDTIASLGLNGPEFAVTRAGIHRPFDDGDIAAVRRRLAELNVGLHTAGALPVVGTSFAALHLVVAGVLQATGDPKA